MTAFTAAADLRFSNSAAPTAAPSCNIRLTSALSDLKPIAAEEIERRLQAIDWGPIAFQLTDSRSGLGWPSDRAASALTGYLQFLRAIALFPHLPLAPSREVDCVWHCHLLDTQKYAADCQFLFGRFINHNPYFGLEQDTGAIALRAAWQQTCDALMRTSSAMPPSSAWSDGPTTCILSNGEIVHRPRRAVCVAANLAVQL